MLAYTVFGEAGGIKKTTTAGNLAVAHQRRGREVLAVDLDPQTGGLSYLLGVSPPREDPAADNIVRHMIGQPKGTFTDLVLTSPEGVDVVPSHQMLGKFPELLKQAATMAEQMGDEFDPHGQLLRVLKDAGVADEYDVLIIDPPATGEKYHTNAINATRSVVIPVELSAKGDTSIEGVDDLVDGMERTLGISIGVLAMVPTEFKGTKAQKERLEEIHGSEYSVPVVIGDRTSLADRFWDGRQSVFGYADTHALRDYEEDYPTKFDELAAHLEQQAKLPEASNRAWEVPA